jgi:uncharacterized protein DUF4258
MADRLIFRVHAVQRMYERRISERDVREILTAGDTIEQYLDDPPYPSRLVLGWCREHALHLVIADDTEAHEIVVSTVYEPDPALWEPGFRQRRWPWNA